MTSGWRIGSIFGIPFLLNPAWFGSLLLFAFFFSADWLAAGWESRWAWLAGLLMALLLFASVLLHELGHSLVAQSQGIAVNAITLFPFGGIASIAQESKTPGQAFWVAISGPAVSFALFVLLFVTSLLLPTGLPLKTMLNHLAGINLVLAMFNMLPGLPLDGGQVLKALIWKTTGSRVKGVRWAAQSGQVLGWLGIGLGILGFLVSLRFSFLWLVLLGWFGIRRASAYRRVIALQEAMLQIPASEAMTRDFKRVDANLPLSEFTATYLTDDPDSAIYYAETSGRYVGLVQVEALRSIERSLWDFQTVQAIAQPLEELPTVNESTSLAQVIDQLETEQVPRLSVLSSAGAVVGVIDRADVVQALATKLRLLVPETVIQQIKTESQFPDNLQLQGVARDALR
ncbi:MAG: site-2 protease family protein [Elainella sp. C42_A2020_010]|nr:site-2 protease family protein [Elainella sp. C42_A2020_010]